MNRVIDEITCQFPDDWRRTQLSEVVEKVADRDHFTPTYVDHGIPIISPKDFGQNDKISFEKCKYITREAHELNRKKTDLKVNDIVFTRIGSVGKSSLVTFEMPEFSILHSAAMIRASVGKIEPLYLLYYLKSDLLQRQIGVEVQSIGVPDLGLDKINRFAVIAPEVSEQRKIAKILSTVDTLIEKTQALIDKYQSIKQGMMHDLFTRGVDENGLLRPSYEKAPHLYKESELGWIPEEWDLRSFDELGEYVNGNSFDVESWCEDGLPIIRIQNINGSDDFNYYDGPVDPAWEVLPGDLLFAWSGTLNTSFGPSIWRGNRGVLNQHIFKVRAKCSLISKNFLFLLLNYKMEEIVKNAHGFKSSFVHITRGELTSVMCEVAGLDEQQRITARLDSLDRKINLEKKALSIYQMLKSGLMQDLLTGKVRVKVDDEGKAVA